MSLGDGCGKLGDQDLLHQCKCKQKMGEEQWKAAGKAGGGTGISTGGGTLGGGHRVGLPSHEHPS